MAIFSRRGSSLPTAGLYHYLRQDETGKVRVHLRLDADGNGTLIINANQILHLNPSAALMAWLILEGKSPDESVRLLRRRFRVSRPQALADLEATRQTIDSLLHPDEACLLHDFNLETHAPFSARPSAPYRMDIALTYRCNNDCAHCYNARARQFPELSTDDWKRVLDQLWALGIPHIVFTGGEPTLRNDLPELVAHAEKNGQITGLNTNARRLQDARFLDALVKAGLDHVQITVESSEAAVHDRMVMAKGAWKQTIAGLKNALASPLFVMTNTTMLRENVHTIPETLDFLAGLGVPTIGLNALIYAGHGSTVGTGLHPHELEPLLATARAKTARYGQKLIWYTPTQYCHFDPTQAGLGVKGCTAALYNMCLEPNGDVLPCQSYYQSLGNILRDDWQAIWEHDLARWLRERRYAPAACHDCAIFAECGAGCPLELEARQPAIIPVDALSVTPPTVPTHFYLD